MGRKTDTQGRTDGRWESGLSLFRRARRRSEDRLDTVMLFEVALKARHAKGSGPVRPWAHVPYPAAPSQSLLRVPSYLWSLGLSFPGPVWVV